MKTLRLNSTFFTLGILLSLSQFNCKKDPLVLDYINVRGYVIAKETCNTDENLDYWLIDLTMDPNTPQYGTAIVINGIPYSNVVKTKLLATELKSLGKTVFFHFKTTSSIPVITTGCIVTAPVTYSVKEINILEQGEAL